MRSVDHYADIINHAAPQYIARCATGGTWEFPEESEFSLILAIQENHTVCELRRAIDTATFERSPWLIQNSRLRREFLR